MTAACARVGANAPNGSDAGSLAAEMRGGSVELVKKSSWQACGSVACIADFAAPIQLACRPSEPSERAGTHTSGPFRLRCGQPPSAINQVWWLRVPAFSPGRRITPASLKSPCDGAGTNCLAADSCAE